MSGRYEAQVHLRIGIVIRVIILLVDSESFSDRCLAATGFAHLVHRDLGRCGRGVDRGVGRRRWGGKPRVFASIRGGIDALILLHSCVSSCRSGYNCEELCATVAKCHGLPLSWRVLRRRV